MTVTTVSVSCRVRRVAFSAQRLMANPRGAPSRAPNVITITRAIGQEKTIPGSLMKFFVHETSKLVPAVLHVHEPHDIDTRQDGAERSCRR